MKYIILLLIIFNVVLSARWIIDGNLFFHTDIARDFLLMEDIVNNKHLVLIGPRSGAIPGLFHGPLWLYLNLPAYLIGQGDPVFVGWFWVILYVLGLYITYSVGKKMFGEEEGLLSALLLSTVTILGVRAFFNPLGALILSPLYLFLFYKYLKEKRIKILLIALFVLGLIIQFQMAFGVPILLLTILYLLYYLFKNKKLPHLIAFFILLIPFSTYILFDIRNKFLEVKSVIDYIWGSQSHGKLNISFIQLLTLRFKESVFDGFGTLTQNNNYLTLALFLVTVWGFYKIYKSKSLKFSSPQIIFLYFYSGFWFFAIFFKGSLWGYYFLPFIPLLSLIFVSLRKNINSVIFYSLFIAIYILNLQVAVRDIFSYNSDAAKQDVSTWKFNKLVAEKVFSGSENTFGYFIFTPDLYGYSPRFALDFYQKRHPEKKVEPYAKETITYLVIAPPPEYGKDPNSIWYKVNTNSSKWKANDIRINRNAEKIISFNNGFSIERYQLSEEDIKVEANQYLINGIFFR